MSYKSCLRCLNDREHTEDDYICIICRFNSDHRFKRDGHTVTFSVAHRGAIGVQPNCPNSAGDMDAPCYMHGDRPAYDRCLVFLEMQESGNAMELITDPYNGDYEITSSDIPIEWYYRTSNYDGEWDCEFGWRIADGPEPFVE